MFNLLRAATETEVKQIAETSDLGPGCVVVALDTPNGPILSVVRQCWEVDPMHFPEGCDARHKSTYLRDIMNFLIGRGALSFYFNVTADEANADWRNACITRGAEQVSKEPVIRFKRDLNVNS